MKKAHWRLQGMWKTTPEICGKQGKISGGSAPALTGWANLWRAYGATGEAKRDSSLRSE
jgi:hypothetical protein